MNKQRITFLKRLVKLFILVMVFTFIYITLDFSSPDSDESGQSLTRLSLPELETDQAYFFKIDNRLIVVIRYSDSLQYKLFQQELMNASEMPQFYVALAYGTYLGCPLLSIDGPALKESCSDARYDFAGRPMDSKLDFTALRVPVYNFCPDYSCINLQI